MLIRSRSPCRRSTTSFQIAGGGSLFQLGPEVTANQQVNIGLFSVAATQLGGTLNSNTAGALELQFLSSLKSGGSNGLDGNLTNASSILETAIEEVSILRGRMAFSAGFALSNCCRVK